MVDKNNKDFIRKLVFSIIGGVVLIGIVIVGTSDSTEESDKSLDFSIRDTTEKVLEENNIEYESNDKKEAINEVLSILYTLYNITQFDSQGTDNPDQIVYEHLLEAMNDLNKLENLTYRTEVIMNKKDKLISTMGLVLYSANISLIDSNKTWISYLRSFDIYNYDSSEFQYQMALFLSSNKDAYLGLAQNMYIFPTIVLEFSEDGEENSVNADLRDYFLSEIDRLFSDAFIDDDLFYRQTQNRNAVIVLVRGYKEYLTGETY